MQGVNKAIDYIDENMIGNVDNIRVAKKAVRMQTDYIFSKLKENMRSGLGEFSFVHAKVIKLLESELKT